MRPTARLLLTILPLVSATAVGCGDKDDDEDTGGDGSLGVLQDGSACIYVDEDATCPDPADVDKSTMMGSCGSTVVNITGPGTYEDNVNWWAGDTGAAPGCCYPVRETAPTCVYGRPLKSADGHATLAARTADPAWAAALCPADAPPSVRAALASRWTRAALDEHASVAAFAKVSLELLRFGAPPDLVARTHQAALDEVRHAGLGFAVASAFSDTPVGPGPMPLSTVPLAETLAEFAAETAREGCLGEGLASLLAVVAAERVADPVLKRVLATIAEDEAEHARLAWRTVRWAIETGGPEVARAVAAVFQDAVEKGIAVPEAPEADLSSWGLLSRAEAEALGRACLAEVVVPAARALLGDGVPLGHTVHAS